MRRAIGEDMGHFGGVNPHLNDIELLEKLEASRWPAMKKQVLAPEVAEMEEQPVPLDVALKRLAVPPSEEDIAETMALVRWFVGRYPTAKERFAYVRRKYAEWTRNPPARLPGGTGREP